MHYCLSYLMGATNIQDRMLQDLGIEIMSKSVSGSRKLKVPEISVQKYLSLIKDKLSEGFWNETVCSENIKFIFKFKDGSIKEYALSLDNENEISNLCSKFSGDSPDKTANVYKYISDNDFYHDFMTKYYSNLINR